MPIPPAAPSRPQLCTIAEGIVVHLPSVQAYQPPPTPQYLEQYGISSENEESLQAAEMHQVRRYN
ncbi:hypothetical protein BJV82DRAFT_661959 [Fennellomyces sp. T-0311]|nr:hypothetical protein BJV82DRAFT_661959 [Fennellomyces sp. T-0311]